MAEFEMGRGQWQQARERLDRAIALQRAFLTATPGDPEARQFLGFHLANRSKVHWALNQPALAIRVARESAAMGQGNPSLLYEAACAMATGVPLVPGDRREALAAESVQMLKAAGAAGWNDAVKTSDAADLRVLRERDDFRRLLAELFDRAFPANPFTR